MAANYYFRIPGMIGGSKDGFYLGWFELDYWRVELDGGKTKFDTIRFKIAETEYIHDLLEGVRSGRHFDGATIDSTRSNGSLRTRVELTDVVLASFDTLFEINFASYASVNFDPLAHESPHGR
jgi:hypothetical protein